jgi:hypothetical protein
LIQDNVPYHKFYDNILANEKDLFDKFESWLSKDKHEATEIAQKSEWCAELIMFELNHIYAVWYGDEPKFTKLSPGLREHLFNERLSYHNRLAAIETRTILRRS